MSMCSFIGLTLRLKKKIQCCRDVIHVSASRVVNITSGKKVDVGRLETDMALNLPCQIHVKGSADITGSTAGRRDCNVTRHAIDRVVARITPEHVCAAVHGESARQLQAGVGMHIYDVLRPKEACVVEITGFEIKGVKSSQGSALRAVTATGNVRLYSESRLQRCIERVAGIQAC